MIWVLAALAQEAPPLLGEGIQVLPYGTQLQRPGEGLLLLGEKGFFLPEPMYNQALVKAKHLERCLPQLQESQDKILEVLDRHHETIQKCTVQFGDDGKLTADLGKQLAVTEEKLLLTKDRLKRSTVVNLGLSGALALAIGGLVLAL